MQTWSARRHACHRSVFLPEWYNIRLVQTHGSTRRVPVSPANLSRMRHQTWTQARGIQMGEKRSSSKRDRDRASSGLMLVNYKKLP